MTTGQFIAAGLNALVVAVLSYYFVRERRILNRGYILAALTFNVHVIVRYIAVLIFSADRFDPTEIAIMNGWGTGIIIHGTILLPLIVISIIHTRRKSCRPNP